MPWAESSVFAPPNEGPRGAGRDSQRQKGTGNSRWSGGGAWVAEGPDVGARGSLDVVVVGGNLLDGGEGGAGFREAVRGQEMFLFT